MNEQQEKVGSVDVRVTVKSVHNAVRNILANEMRLDPIAIKEEVRNQAFALIRTEVIEQLTKKGYGDIGLQEWAQRAMTARMNDVDKMLKEVVRELVGEAIRKKVNEESIQVVEAILKDGLEIRVGWNHKVKIKVTEKEST